MLFSKRYGFVQNEKLQSVSMNDDLRVSIWNCLLVNSKRSGFWGVKRYDVLQQIWLRVINRPIDEMMDDDFDYNIEQIKQFVLKGEWSKVYDLVEVVVEIEEAMFEKHSIKHDINSCLEHHCSGYRMVDGRIAPITSKEELFEIEQALSSAQRFEGVQQHIKSALALLGKRECSDYRNSIKESISAVESLAIQLSGGKNGTLGQLLDKMQSSYGLHPALAKGFSSIYGWTSNEGGIRHAMIVEPNVTVADARFMLIACSAFINYVIDKTNTSPQES